MKIRVILSNRKKPDRWRQGFLQTMGRNELRICLAGTTHAADKLQFKSLRPILNNLLEKLETCTLLIFNHYSNPNESKFSCVSGCFMVEFLQSSLYFFNFIVINTSHGEGSYPSARDCMKRNKSKYGAELKMADHTVAHSTLDILK